MDSSTNMTMVLIAVITSIGASSGFWAFVARKDTHQDSTRKLLLGLAHEKIISLGMMYLDRGSISKDEYEDFVKYLYQPYSTFGGNGLAERVMNDVNKLPMRGPTRMELHIRKDDHDQRAH